MVFATQAGFVAQFPEHAPVFNLSEISDSIVTEWPKLNVQQFMDQGVVNVQLTEQFVDWLQQRSQEWVTQRRASKGLVTMPYVHKVLNEADDVPFDLNLNQVKHLLKDVASPCSGFLLDFMLASGRVDPPSDKDSIQAVLDMRAKVNAAKAAAEQVAASEAATAFITPERLKLMNAKLIDWSKVFDIKIDECLEKLINESTPLVQSLVDVADDVDFHIEKKMLAAMKSRASTYEGYTSPPSSSRSSSSS